MTEPTPQEPDLKARRRERLKAVVSIFVVDMETHGKPTEAATVAAYFAEAMDDLAKAEALLTRQGELEAEIARLREALKPFADWAVRSGALDDKIDQWGGWFSPAEFKAAYRALHPEGGEAK